VTLKGVVELLGKFWKPDTFFYSATNEALHSVPNPDVFVRISPEERSLSVNEFCADFCEAKNKEISACSIESESY
jgi:hypothetical protein